MNFTEIFRLKKMLEEAKIPFQFSENFHGLRGSREGSSETCGQTAVFFVDN